MTTKPEAAETPECVEQLKQYEQLDSHGIMVAVPRQAADEMITYIANLERSLRDALARIDALMLEYCPDEMTPEQVNEWGKHQRAEAPTSGEGKA
jgi:hypothetical protein